MRPIDADALIERCERVASIEFNKLSAPKSWASAYEDFICVLEETPTIEAEPVIHSKWIRDGDFLICMNCESEINIKNSLGIENSNNYCPNCCAKMGEEIVALIWRNKMKTPFINDPFVIVWQAFKELYPDKDCKCYFGTEEDCDQEFGLTHFDGDGEIQVIINANLPVQDAVEIFAHELAHVAAGVGHDHDEVWEKAFDDIYDKYNEILERLRK